MSGLTNQKFRAEEEKQRLITEIISDHCAGRFDQGKHGFTSKKSEEESRDIQGLE